MDVRDVAISAIAVALDLAMFTRITQLPGMSHWIAIDVPWWVVVAAGLAPFPALLIRRRAPMTTSVGLATYSVVQTLLLGSRPIATLLVALYNAAAWRPARRSLLSLIATLLANSVALAYESAVLSETALTILEIGLLYVLFDATAWSVGWWVGSARRQAIYLATTRDAMAADAVATERLRIARELHDIVAHAVTVMVLQASGARRLIAREPELAGQAMQSVEDVGKQAMAEMRRLLDVLRTVGSSEDTDGQGGRDNEGIRPRLNSITALLGQVEASGISVRSTTQGIPGRLDPSVDLAAYRVIQEALTNVTRHAGPGTSVQLDMTWTGDTLHVDIRDDGGGIPPPSIGGLSSGYGLIGLRERVKLIGGSLEARPSASSEGHRRGYHVSATFPAEPMP